MIWNPTFCLRSVAFAVGFSFAASCLLRAESVQLVNGSTNLTAYIETSAGRAVALPGQTIPWDGAPEDVVAYGTNDVFISSWAIGPGHEYDVFVGNGGSITVVDQSPYQTKWFMSGFALVFIAGLTGWAASNTRLIIGGSVNE